MAQNTIATALTEIEIKLKEAQLTYDSRKETLKVLAEYHGAYEALVKFAQDCTPVEEGEFEDWEYALDMCGPDIDAGGDLSFEIPYSRYVWDAKGQTWKNQDDDSDEDEEEVPDSEG